MLFFSSNSKLVIIWRQIWIDMNVWITGHNIIQCLEPVPTAGLTMDDVPKLRDEIKNIMENAYKELSEEVLTALPPDYPLATQDWEN